MIKRGSRVPGLRKLITPLWNTYEHIKFSYYVRRNIMFEHWNSAMDPFEIYWISPKKINIPTSSVEFDFITDTSKTYNGDWDMNVAGIQTGIYYKSFVERFDEKKPWEQTPIYKDRADRINRGTDTRYVSVSEYKEKLQFYDQLYHDFKSGNYYLQSELVDRKQIDLPGDGGRGLFPRFTDKSLIRHEVAVNIGRDGRFIRNDGRHRLALAFLAGLDEIPVRVVVRHTQWQILRDKVVQSINKFINSGISTNSILEAVEDNLDEELKDVFMGIDHPDIQSIFDQHLPRE